MDLNGLIYLIIVSYISSADRVSGRSRRDACNDRSCFPISGNLLIGRKNNITTDSTCGLLREETYCNLINVNRFDRGTEQRSECFKCDSRDPNGPNSHRIENIVSFFKKDNKDQWWQAQSERNKVSIQLDLEAEFHVTHVLMTFRTFRPAAMLIERSYDFGKTWKVYRYFAFKCRKSWPGIPLERRRTKIDEPYCEPLGNPGIPSTGAELVMKVLNPNKHLSNPYSEEVQNLIKLTNLRVNFTQLFTLGDNLLGSKKKSYYYALYNMVVSGFCSCYGHAEQCIPLHAQSTRGMVYGKCECKHHTTGHNCERCLPFYQDLPWRPANGEKKNECKQCNCNNHSTKCHFDPAVFEASQQISGGVCDDCQDNSMGQNCAHCKPNYYRNPSVPINHPNTCMQCDCDPRGAEHMGECESFSDEASGMQAGKCTCKSLVTGARCDTCLTGYFDLDAANPDGCQACSCNAVGTVEGHECEGQSGECRCKRFVTGRSCDTCMKGYWGLGTDPQGCKQCNCDVGGSMEAQCDSWRGDCRCRPHVVGRYCNQVEEGYYYPQLDWLLYEAELATPKQDVELENRERGTGEVTWTGSGYMRVHEGTSLEFNVDNIPYSMHYNLLVRYEAKMLNRWDGIKVKVEKLGGGERSWGACHNHVPSDDHKTFSIDPYTRYVVISPSSCFEKNVQYKIIITFPVYNSQEDMYLYVDSLVLLPGTTGHPIFQNTDNLEIPNIFKRYRCIDQFYIPQPSDASSQISQAKDCNHLVFSSSVAINDGAKPCDCHPLGSESRECDVRGGQCRCRPNVIGRKCDKCAPRHYALSNQGCIACDCHPLGSMGIDCDQRTGKCPCKPNSYGQKCGDCQPNHWDFPQCRKCQCNGRSVECDNDSGACIRCRDHSGGHNCERCADGYYGEIRTGCRRCPCPGGQMSHASSCDVRGDHVVCHCRHGYAGERCEVCMDGFHGQPTLPGGKCEACSCHGNIDPAAPGACDTRTGECTRCLHNTEGRQCEKCKKGYFGDALRQTCIPCACNPLGTRGDQLQSCDPISGTCPCLPHVDGKECDSCEVNHWKLASGKGCEACRCYSQGSHSSQCNQFDGQCQCRAGRGGRDCTECSNHHWGNPNMQCQRCKCNSQGSIGQQCNKQTGACECKKGVSGYSCNRCARGATGSLPNCIPCGPCYDSWERQINEMNVDLEEIAKISKGVETSGPSQSYPQEFYFMELMLTEIKQLVKQNEPGWSDSQDVDRLYRTIHELKLNVSNYDRQLDGMEHQARNTSAHIYGLSERMNNINYRIEQLLKLVFELKNNATGIQEKDVTGAYDSIKESYNRSNMFKNHVNQMSDNRYRSQQTRTNADRLLDLKKSDIDRMSGNNRQVLRQLQHDLSNSKRSLVKLNNLVCDGHGDPCDHICGGAGCGHCGIGNTCQQGSVYKANNALDLANQAQDIANAKRNEMETINSKVEYRLQQCMTLQQLVNRVYKETSQLHNASSTSSSDVGLFINEVHLFIQEIDTYPHQVKELALVVLNYRIEPTARDIEELSRKILTILGSLTQIDRIILSTRDTLQEVNRLQARANKARDSAEEVKGSVDKTTNSLHETTRSQHDVRKSLDTLQKRIKDMDGELGKIGNLSTSGLTEFTKLVSYNVAGRINLMKQKIFKNEADVKKVTQTVKQTEELNKRIKKITKNIDNDNNGVMNDILAQTKDLSSFQDRVALIKNKADLVRIKMFDWKAFISEWKEKYNMRKKKFIKWNEDAYKHIGNMDVLVKDIRRAERYLRNC